MCGFFSSYFEILKEISHLEGFATVQFVTITVFHLFSSLHEICLKTIHF